MSATDYSDALARGLAVLAAFDADHQLLTQADLARQLGLSRATVRRTVLTLQHLGYLEAEGRSYALSPHILRVAESYLTSNVISTVLQPACDKLSEHLDASCSVAVLDGEDAVMIARAVPNRMIATGSGVGFRVPAHRSALGSVLRANLNQSPSATERAEKHPIDRRSMTKVRDDGFSYVAHEVEVGFHSVAVPVHRWDGRVVAAMNVGATLEQLPPEAMTGPVLDALRTCAAELRTRLV